MMRCKTAAGVETIIVWPEFRSPCSVSSALDVVGDKWTLIVLRTMFAGRRRFGELADIPERISTNILADRLEQLECSGLIAKRPYQQGPTRYEYRLTRRGADLLPVLQALAAWASAHIPGRWAQPDWFVGGRPKDFYPDEDEAAPPDAEAPQRPRT